MEIGLPVPEKKRFLKDFDHIWAWRPTWSYLEIFISMYLEAYIQNLVKRSPVVCEKSKFKFSYINGFGPRSRNDTVLEYSHMFINSISCLNLPNFMSQAAIVSEKIHCFHVFP